MDNKTVTNNILKLYRRSFITFDEAIKSVKDCDCCTVKEFALLVGRRYKVIADTNHGSVSEWYFQDFGDASRWVYELESNYGCDCTIIDLDNDEEV